MSDNLNVYNNSGEAGQGSAVRSYNDYLFLFSFFLMIVMTIINGNMYLAGLSFVWFPSFLLLGASIIEKRQTFFCKRNLIVFFIAVSAVYSTVRSDVVPAGPTYYNLLFCLIWYAVVTTVKYDNRMIRTIFAFYRSFAVLICMIMCVNYVISYGVSVNGRISIRYFGITKDVNYLTAFLVPAYACNFYCAVFANRKKYFFSCIIILIAIFLAGSRSVFISALLASILIFSKMLMSVKVSFKRKLTYLFFLFAGGVSFILITMKNPLFNRMTSTDGYEDNVRLIIWNYALEAFYRRKLFGSGVTSGSFFSQLHVQWVTHNAFLDILTGQGIIGAILVIFLFINVASVKRSNLLFIIAYMITSFLPLFFVNGWECATFWMPMILCTVLSEACSDNDNVLTVLQ